MSNLLLFHAPSPCKEDAHLSSYKSDYTAFSMKGEKTQRNMRIALQLQPVCDWCRKNHTVVSKELVQSKGTTICAVSVSPWSAQR